MMAVYCDRTTCDHNCDCECVLDIIHVDGNGECCELTDNPYKDGDTKRDKMLRDTVTDLLQPKLPNAISLKEKFKAERSSQKENSWAKILALIENAMKEGKGYVKIYSDTYKNIPLRELSHEIKKAKYKLRDNTCGLAVKYCYDMGYSLIICWE